MFKIYTLKYYNLLKQRSIWLNHRWPFYLSRFWLLCFDPLVYFLPKTFNCFRLSIYWIWQYLMEVIPERRCVHYIRFLRIYYCPTLPCIHTYSRQSSCTRSLYLLLNRFPPLFTNSQNSIITFVVTFVSSRNVCDGNFNVMFLSFCSWTILSLPFMEKLS